MKKTILVTGGAGYIGSLLVPRLLKEHWAVRVFDSFFFGKTHLQKLKGPLSLVQGDIRTIDKSVLKNIECIIHLAGISNDPMADFAPRLNYEINFHATKRLAMLAKSMAIKDMLFASSCSIYHSKYSTKKEYHEDDPVNPHSHYSKSKFQAEKALFKLCDNKFNVTVVRMATVGGYSPRMKFDLVLNTMVKTALNEGKIYVYAGDQDRPLVDIRDVINLYTTILNAAKHKIRSQLFNLAFSNYTISDLAKEIMQVCLVHDKKVEIIVKKPSYKVKSYRVSNDKLQKILGFKPKYSASQTAKHLIRQIRRHGITDFENPIYYNFIWTKPVLERMMQGVK